MLFLQYFGQPVQRNLRKKIPICSVLLVRTALIVMIGSWDTCSYNQTIETTHVKGILTGIKV